MKDDLIKRSDVLNLLDEMYKQEKDLMRSIWVRDSIKSRIEEMPTVYDVKKVLEQLEEMLNPEIEKRRCFSTSCDITHKCTDCVLKYAIEIVKDGGMDDR